MTLSTTDAPKLLDKSTRKVYIKGGKRKFMSDDGTTYMSARLARKLFGKQKGGKYSLKQDGDKT